MSFNNSDETILVINAGSSSIKFSLFMSCSLTLMYQGSITSILEKPQFNVANNQHEQVLNIEVPMPGYESALIFLFDWLENLPHKPVLTAVGHRVVHGGGTFNDPVLITAEVMKKLMMFIPLAPLHQPHNLALINIISKFFPKLDQVACFDTSFHQTQEKLVTLFAIPRSLSAQGIIRYGFHGISYEYIASALPPPIKNKKVIVAHLGNGASMCAMEDGKSVATSMGFTALDGLMMGTRCGEIDPGVLLYLLEEKKFSTKQVTNLLYQKSGLLGVSGITADMSELQSSTESNAIEAVNLFCYRAARELCALCCNIQGCDAIIFTAGIGEHSALVRKKICERLTWLGVVLDERANLRNDSVLSQPNSKVFVAVIPTNEEFIIAKHTLKVVLEK